MTSTQVAAYTNDNTMARLHSETIPTSTLAATARVKELHEQPLRPSPYYYLCGVSKPYVRSRNFHLAFREKEGSLLSVSRQGIQVEIENAEEIAFS